MKSLVSEQKAGVVLFISPSIRDLYMSCAGTITRFTEGGYSTYGLIIIQTNIPDTQDQKKESIEINTKRMGISKTYVVSGFDYSTVTQNNADLLNRVVQAVSPSIVIMPFWQSTNQFYRILAKSALIACRGIGTIFMYDFDRNNPRYDPSFFVPISHSTSVQKDSFVSKANHSLLGQSRSRNKDSVTTFTRSSFDYENRSEHAADRYQRNLNHHFNDNDNRMEIFVSHRILLLDENVNI